MRWSKKEKKTRNDLGLLESHIIIGAIGYFDPSTNFSFLLTIFALLYDNHQTIYLILIGSGKQKQFLRKRSSDL